MCEKRNEKVMDHWPCSSATCSDAHSGSIIPVTIAYYIDPVDIDLLLIRSQMSSGHSVRPAGGDRSGRSKRLVY